MSGICYPHPKVFFPLYFKFSVFYFEGGSACTGLVFIYSGTLVYLYISILLIMNIYITISGIHETY